MIPDTERDEFQRMVEQQHEECESAAECVSFESRIVCTAGGNVTVRRVRIGRYHLLEVEVAGVASPTTVRMSAEEGRDLLDCIQVVTGLKDRGG